MSMGLIHEGETDESPGNGDPGASTGVTAPWGEQFPVMTKSGLGPWRWGAEVTAAEVVRETGSQVLGGPFMFTRKSP